MKTIRAVFRPGAKRVTAEESVTQWDYGRLLVIEGLNLPNSFEVDFSLDPQNGLAEPAIGTDNAVRIPDVLLEVGQTIYAFIFLHEEQDDGETRYRIAIPVEKRPGRGTKEPDPVEQSIITQTIAAMNETLQSVQDEAGAAEAAKNAIINLGVEAENLEPESQATVEKRVDGETGEVTLVFGIPEGKRGMRGQCGPQGFTFTPSVSAEGVLTWTNNGNHENPEPLDIVTAVLDALPRAEGGSY